MSTQTIMVFALSLLALLISVSFVHSDQSMLPLRFLKISENVTYECIDIYKQPGLDHPLLKNHKIQMKPSVSRHETKINRTYTKGTGCPFRTVPILRNTNIYISNAQLFSEKIIHPLTKDAPGAHIAGVQINKGPHHGVEVWLEGYNLNINNDQISYSEVSMGSRLNNEINYIQAGLMINPSVFGDRRLWSYLFWMGKDGIGRGCYDKPCSGFVQVSRKIPIAKPYYPTRDYPAQLFYSIHQDTKTRNWWVQRDGAYIGYWPAELFDLLNNGTKLIQVGGMVQASPSGSSPPMGNGKFPNGGDKESAKFAIIHVLNSNYEKATFPIQILVDSPNCYGCRTTQTKGPGFFFNYGGPGGNSCGI